MGLPPKLEILVYTVNTLLRKRRYHAALAVLKGFRNGAVLRGIQKMFSHIVKRIERVKKTFTKSQIIRSIDLKDDPDKTTIDFKRLSLNSRMTDPCYGAKIRAPHALVMTFLFRSGSLKEKLKAIVQATYTHSRNLAYFVFTYKGLCALQSRIQGQTFQFHSFLAACIGGWLVFGENNNINSQINMYLLSRTLFGLARLAVEKGFLPEPKQDPFPLFSSVIWGLILWLFEYHRHTLQPSLQSSMTYLYDDSNVWHDITDFLIYNKSHSRK